jgi:hypothetical protein
LENPQRLRQYAKLGFTSDEINKVTEATLYLAQATGSDLSQAAAVAGATLGGFQMEAKETARVTDIMAASFSSTPLDITTFQESMKAVAPVALSAGVSIEQTTAMLGVMAKAGIVGSAAGTGLRRILSELGKTGGDVGEELRKLGAKGLDMGEAMNLVGKNAYSSLLVLANGTSLMDELTTAFENSEGAAKATADTMNAGAEGGIKEMISALEGVAISIGTILTPALKKLTDFIKVIAQKFEGLSTNSKSVITTMAAAAAGAGILLRVFGGLGTSMIKLIGIYKVKKAAVLADIVGTRTATGAHRAHAGAVAAGSLALKGFRTALISTGIGALVVALGYAVGMLIDYVTQTDDAATAETEFQTAVDLTNEALKERAKILGKKDTSGDSISQLRERTRAIQSEIDALSVDDLVDNLTVGGNLVGGVVSDVLESTIQDAFENFNDLLTNDDVGQLFSNYEEFIGGRGAELLRTAVSQTRDELRRQKEEAESAIRELQNKADGGQIIKDDRTFTDVSNELAKSIENIEKRNNLLGESFNTNKEFLRAYKQAFDEIVDSGMDVTVEDLELIVQNIRNLETITGKDGIKLFADSTTNEIPGLLESLNAIEAVTIEVEDKFKRMSSSFETAFGIMSSSMQQMASDGETYFNSLATSIGRAVRQIISAQIAQAVSMAILDALKKSGGNPFIGGILAGAGATAAKGLFDSLVTPFALGGIVTKPTLSLLGEAGTEAVVPFNRMDEFMNMAGAGASGGQVGVSGRITGNDIFLSNKYAMNQSGRRRVII